MRTRNPITEINSKLREAGLTDIAFRPRNSRESVVCINLDADEDRPGKICQTMRNIGYVLHGDCGWQLIFKRA